MTRPSRKLLPQDLLDDERGPAGPQARLRGPRILVGDIVGGFALAFLIIVLFSIA